MDTMLRASPALFVTWALLCVVRMLLPSAFAVFLGIASVDLVRDGIWQPTVLLSIFVALLSQVLPPIHTAVSQNLGALTGARITDQLIELSTQPTGIGHLETSELADDINIAREFDYGITSLPMWMSVEFVTAELVPFAAGWIAAITLVAYDWWMPVPLIGAWLFTHWALKRSAVWAGRNSDDANDARRESEYYFNVAVQPTDAKEVRLFGLASFIVARFTRARRRLFDLQYADTRLSPFWLATAGAVILLANIAAFGWLASSASNGRPLDAVVTVTQLIIAVQAVAFGTLSWVLDDGTAPIDAVRRLRAAVPGRPSSPVVHSAARDSGQATAVPRATVPERVSGVQLDFDDVKFRYPSDDRLILSGLSFRVQAGESLAIVGANGAGKTTLAKLICRFYEPASGEIYTDGRQLSATDPEEWRADITAVFQEILKLHLTVAENVDPGGRASHSEVVQALADAGLPELEPTVVLGKTLPGGTDLSGGQWQRVALARSICAVRNGARLVLLDEPTANLDVRGEHEVFRDYLDHTSGATRILISHRFSTVRMADRIVVLENGAITEAGSHDELMDRGQEYARMYNLQASRFVEGRS
ncbi:ABC transporter ATP-binding protein [Kribbella sp. DT2]|uniref:ABC transporter ATP-binding protein n=1 Tax=Kribbella sp. DT2 TaxID=3393427 RepID=UPI003CF31693